MSNLTQVYPDYDFTPLTFIVDVLRPVEGGVLHVEAAVVVHGVV